MGGAHHHASLDTTQVNIEKLDHLNWMEQVASWKDGNYIGNCLAPKFEKVCKQHGVEYWSEPSLSRSLGILYEAIVDLKDRPPVEFGSKKTN